MMLFGRAIALGILLQVGHIFQLVFCNTIGPTNATVVESADQYSKNKTLAANSSELKNGLSSRTEKPGSQLLGNVQKRALPMEPGNLLSSPHCEPFENVDSDAKTLYSPGYPGNYPNNTDCNVVIEAPPGYLIRLDFRDYFHIEPSEECKFDFIEIRDGGHGFSTLIGQFCGTEFPPMLTSRERRLWLRFHSDENIEYQGFAIVYEFIPRPTSSLYEDTSCRFELTGHEGWVNRSDIPVEKVEANVMHNLPLDCMWVINVDPGWKIQIAFLQFQLERPNDCDSNFVDVFGEQTDIPNRIKNFCGSIADSVTSKENILHIRFYTEIAAIDSTFSILFTAFRDKPIGQACDEQTEYDCEDATCISSDLRCNGRVNCRFRWDEDECLTEVAGQSDHVIIVIVVFTLILSTIFIAFIISCCQKLIRDHKIIREHIRQSKESKLDELGRHSTKWSDKSQIQIRDLECMSVKYPPPSFTPISRKKVSAEDDRNSEHMSIPPGGHRYGFHDFAMQPIIPPLHQTELSQSEEKHNQMVGHYSRAIQHPHSGTQSIQDSDHSGAMCDMACQTRESLFQQAPINVNPPAHFSTFGYNGSSINKAAKESLGSSSNEDSENAQCAMQNISLENNQFKPGSSYHNDRRTSLPRRNPNPNKTTPNQPIDRVPPNRKDTNYYSDIRKSAPDVIVMASR